MTPTSGEKGQRTLFIIKCHKAHHIDKYSDLKTEVLIDPFSTFLIDSIGDESNLTIITLKQQEQINFIPYNTVPTIEKFSYLYKSLDTYREAKREHTRAVDQLSHCTTKEPRIIWHFLKARAERYLNSSSLNDTIKKEFGMVLSMTEDLESLNLKKALIHFIRGDTKRLLKSHKDAIEESTIAIDLDPDFMLPYYTRSESLRMTDKDRESLADSSIVRDFDPNYSRIYYTRSESLRMLDEYEQSLHEATISITLNPTHSLAYYTRAEVYRMLSKYELSIKDATKAIINDVQLQLVYYTRAESYRMLDKYDLAIQDATKAIQLDPQYDLAYYTRAFAYHSKGELEKAVEDFTKLLQLDPKNDDGWYWRAECFRELGLKKEAISDARRCLQIVPNDVHTEKLIERLRTVMK